MNERSRNGWDEKRAEQERGCATGVRWLRRGNYGKVNNFRRIIILLAEFLFENFPFLSSKIFTHDFSEFDRYLLKVLDMFWHEDCLKCNSCNCRLVEAGPSLYIKSNLILCKKDYLK